MPSSSPTVVRKPEFIRSETKVESWFCGATTTARKAAWLDQSDRGFVSPVPVGAECWKKQRLEYRRPTDKAVRK